MRLDKYLKVSRLIKRRTVANEACDAGRVFINDKPAKASANVKQGFPFIAISRRFRICETVHLSVDIHFSLIQCQTAYMQVFALYHEHPLIRFKYYLAVLCLWELSLLLYTISF